MIISLTWYLSALDIWLFLLANSTIMMFIIIGAQTTWKDCRWTFYMLVTYSSEVNSLGKIYSFTAVRIWILSNEGRWLYHATVIDIDLIIIYYIIINSMVLESSLLWILCWMLLWHCKVDDIDGYIKKWP